MPKPKIPYKGICVDCEAEANERGYDPEEVWIIKRKPPLCKRHNLIRKEYDRDGINRKRSRTPKRETVQVNGSDIGEREIFEQIWLGLEPKERVSFVTGKQLPDQHSARAWYFSHVLPKGRSKYPMFKFYRKNIVLMTFNEHQLWEYQKYKIKGDPKWAHVFELEKQLKDEYREHKREYESGGTEEYFLIAV